ncbi:M1 family aminopeptidase [Hymenobacter nivis]|nr:M1 family aminopeptidase [Hymenobacter nivis]
MKLLRWCWVLFLVGGLGAPGARAQTSTGPADAGRACAAAHLRAGLGTLAATASGAHRAQLARYDVTYYKLDLALEPTSRDVAGMAWLRVRVGRQALDSLAFDLYQAPAGAPASAATLRIDSVVVNGRQASAVRRAGSEATAALAAPAPAGTLADARIYYHGTAPHDAGGGSAAIGNGLDRADVVTYAGAPHPYQVLWSLSEPFAAPEWFPCKPVLTDKADSSDVWVTTTLPNKVGSNGVLARTVPLPGNRARYEWKSRQPIAYYLISVAVAPYVEYVNYANPAAGGARVPIVNYVYDQAALDFYRAEIDRTPGFIENYARLVGPYPFATEKYGHSMAPLGGGMEHQTMTTQDGFDFVLTAHELFHQWFGDNVTCASWADVWLNESFASYGEYLSYQAFGQPADPANWLNQARGYALRNPGSVFVPDTTSVARIFDYDLSYKKGALVVHMLRGLLNDDAKFFRALQTYQRRYAGGTARTADLQAVFEAEAGRPLGYFFQQWVRGQGYPSLAVRWYQVGPMATVRTTETVSQPAVTPFFDLDVDYLLTFTDGTSQRLRRRLSQAADAFDVPVGTRQVVSISANPDQSLLLLANSSGTDASLVLSARAPAGPALGAFPNPCREALHLPALAGPATAEVFDATGRRVAVQAVPATGAQVATQALAPGLYLLRLTDAHGAVTGQARFARE